jgi:hypothetical protein
MYRAATFGYRKLRFQHLDVARTYAAYEQLKYRYLLVKFIYNPF